MDEIPISHLSVHAHGAWPGLVQHSGVVQSVTLLTHSLAQRQ